MTETPPAITISIMTHNYGRYIQEAIESVLAQGRADWEMFISDDASTDDTAAVVAPYLSDPRIRYVRHETNLGQAGNWGYLLEQGTAPLLAVLHADDAWLPHTLETALGAFESDPELDLFYGNWYRRSGDAKPVLAHHTAARLSSGHEEFRHQCKRLTCLVSAAFVSRRAVQLTDPPDRGLNMVVDYDYFLRFCAVARRVQSAAEPLTMYRVHAVSTTAESAVNGVFLKEREEMPRLIERTAKLHPELLSCMPVLRTQLAMSIFEEGISKVLRGEISEARMLMSKGLRLFPMLIVHPKILINYWLTFLGGGGRFVLHLLHKNRLRNASEAA